MAQRVDLDKTSKIMTDFSMLANPVPREFEGKESVGKGCFLVKLDKWFDSLGGSTRKVEKNFMERG